MHSVCRGSFFLFFPAVPLSTLCSLHLQCPPSCLCESCFLLQQGLGAEHPHEVSRDWPSGELRPEEQEGGNGGAGIPKNPQRDDRNGKGGSGSQDVLYKTVPNRGPITKPGSTPEATEVTTRQGGQAESGKSADQAPGSCHAHPAHSPRMS